MSAGFPCGSVWCSLGAESCLGNTCVCRPNFFGALCEQHLFIARPDLFWAQNVVSFVLFVGLTGFGAYLIAYYWYEKRSFVAQGGGEEMDSYQNFRTKFMPVLGLKESRNPQLIGIVMAASACLIRLVHYIIQFSYGPTIEIQYWQGPSVVQAFTRLTWGLFFPLVVCAEVIQLLLWIDVSMQVKQLRLGAKSWLPRLKWIFWLCVGFAFTGQILVEMLLTFGSGGTAVLLVFRVFLMCFFIFMTAVAVVFGLKLLRAMRESERSGLVDSSQSSRLNASRRNLVRLVMVTLLLFLLAIVLTSLYLAPNVRKSPTGYYTVNFFVLFDSCAVVFMIMITFWTMMRNRLNVAQPRGPALAMKETASATATSSGDSMRRKPDSFASASEPLLQPHEAEYEQSDFVDLRFRPESRDNHHILADRDEAEDSGEWNTIGDEPTAQIDE